MDHPQQHPATLSDGTLATTATTPAPFSVEGGGGGSFSSSPSSSNRSLNQNSMERVKEKGCALLWVIAAVVVGYWTRVPTVLFHANHYSGNNNHRRDGSESNRMDHSSNETTNGLLDDNYNDNDGPRPVIFLLRVVAFMVGVNVMLILYLTVYVPRFAGIPVPLPASKSWSDVWPLYCPRVIPLLTASGLLSFVLLIRATWPVWGFLTPAILSLEALGCFFALHFVPCF